MGQKDELRNNGCCVEINESFYKVIDMLFFIRNKPLDSKL